MSKPEEQRLTEDKPQLVQPDNNEESSSGESDEKPGTSRAVAMQAEMPHGPADAGNQVLQTMENAEASQSALSRIEPGLIELASRVAESRAVMIINAPQFNLRDERHYQDNREYSQMDIRDSKNITPTRVKVKQTNPLDSAKKSKPSIEQQDSANNPFDPPQLNTQPQDPSDVTQPKQPIQANPQVERHTDISEVTNQSNALNTEIRSTTSGNVAIQPTIYQADRNTSGVLEQTGFTQPKQPISTSTSQTAAPSTSPSVASLPTTSSAEQRKDTERRIKEQEAIEKVRQEQKKHREADLRPQAGINVPLQNFPVVHPNLAEVTFYQGGAAPKQETFVASTDHLKGISHERSIDFDNLVRSDKRYTGVIGNPGAGKSTLSKRLAKSEEFTTFHINFMDLPDDDKLTLPEMLININYPNLDEETWKNAFEWVKNNQSQCLLVFDGLDQADFTFKKKFAKRTYDTKQSVQNIIAGLFNKNYLPGVKIIITSRPHSMLNLPHSLQPKRTIFIRDLSYDNMKSLFYAYTGTHAKSLWFQLSQNAPVVFSLCYNPLLLQLVIAASLNPSKDVGEITTTTRVFATVLEGLRRSDNTRYPDITALTQQISRLAYNATKKSTVVITPTEMKKELPSTDDVQDIIVAFHAYSGWSQRVFDGDQKYFFSHQMFQECFTAWYFISQMSLAEFQIFVTNEAFADEKWSVIRRFICGLLIDMLRDCHDRGPVSSTNMQTRSTFSMKGLSPSDVAEKRRIWIKALKSQLVRFEKMQDWSHDDQRRYISLLCELNESSDMELFNMASLRFPTELHLSNLKLSSSEVAIFCDVLRKQQKKLKWLYLMNCFSPDDVERLISAISEMPGKVKVLFISGNIIKDIPGPEFFAKIEKYLCMIGCFEGGRILKEDERDANSSERQKIQLALDQLHDSRLRVHVGYDDDCEDVILTPREYC
ncbi:uncharacterized protein LOC143452596 isoform X2 [Clavelina lepadiformis]|uniref:uncharacterized protein LOC143452596 isoform X2 n=1 Tax=Clavelina lepadiformis TaxID=159417 RepID=UPI0040433496